MLILILIIILMDAKYWYERTHFTTHGSPGLSMCPMHGGAQIRQGAPMAGQSEATGSDYRL